MIRSQRYEIWRRSVAPRANSLACCPKNWRSSACRPPRWIWLVLASSTTPAFLFWPMGWGWLLNEVSRSVLQRGFAYTTFFYMLENEWTLWLVLLSKCLILFFLLHSILVRNPLICLKFRFNYWSLQHHQEWRVTWTLTIFSKPLPFDGCCCHDTPVHNNQATADSICLNQMRALYPALLMCFRLHCWLLGHGIPGWNSFLESWGRGHSPLSRG